MKRFILLSLFVGLYGCSSDDDGGCKCQGEFRLVSDSTGSFFADNVDCETGNPITKNQNDSGNPVFYLGCAD